MGRARPRRPRPLAHRRAKRRKRRRNSTRPSLDTLRLALLPSVDALVADTPAAAPRKKHSSEAVPLLSSDSSATSPSMPASSSSSFEKLPRHSLVFSFSFSLSLNSSTTPTTKQNTDRIRVGAEAPEPREAARRLRGGRRPGDGGEFLFLNVFFERFFFHFLFPHFSAFFFSFESPFLPALLLSGARAAAPAENFACSGCEVSLAFLLREGGGMLLRRPL